MKPTDLRVGNIIKTKHSNGNPNGWSAITVNPVHIQTCYDHNDWFKGIPLTEKWLKDFGFTNSKTQDKFYTKDNTVGVSTADDKFRFIQGNFVCQLVLRDLQYVH